MSAIAAFVCVPMRARPSVSQCVAMRRAADDALSPIDRLRTQRCRDCEVGAAHRTGGLPEAWPDGAPIERVELVAHAAGQSASPPPRQHRTRRLPTVAPIERPAPVPAEEETHMARTRTITIDGRAQSLAEWGRETKLGHAVIGQRLKRGWTELEAVTTGKGEVPPRLADRGRAKPSKAKPTKRSAPPKHATLTKRARRPVAKTTTIGEQVRTALALVPVVELLGKLGYRVEDLGVHPRGRLLVIEEGAAA